MRHSRQRTRRSSASAAKDGPSTSRLSPTQPASQGLGSIASQRSASSSPSCERCRRGRLRAPLCGRAPTRYANASTPPETRSPVFAPRTTRCATSSLVISELNVCSLSASGRADHDDIDELLRMLPAATCLRCKTESLQGIPDPGLVTPRSATRGSLSANNPDDNDDGVEVFRALPAATCLRRKTESSQGIPDPGLVITVDRARAGLTGGRGGRGTDGTLCRLSEVLRRFTSLSN